MNVIIISEEEFKKIYSSINTSIDFQTKKVESRFLEIQTQNESTNRILSMLAVEIKNLQTTSRDNFEKVLEETWLEGRELCELLKISNRTLNRIRDRGDISYSIINNKFIYHMKDVNSLVKKRVIGRNPFSLETIIEDHLKGRKKIQFANV